MEKFMTKNGVSVRAYKGDAMTLLAFDLNSSMKKNFVGFTIKVLTDNNRKFYIYNKMKFNSSVTLHRQLAEWDNVLSSEFSPIQKFRWVHVPSTVHYIENPYFGEYTYQVTPRYVKNNTLLALDPNLTVEVTINVDSFKSGKVELGFTRAFISSQAFGYHFGNKLNLRPNKTDLTFNISKAAGSRTLNGVEKEFTYEEIHQYLGWQARDRVTDFLNEVINNNALKLDVFAYDLNEPVIVDKIMQLAEQGRVRIILDDYPNHKKAGSFEMKFDKAFREKALNTNQIERGCFGSQAHSKIFIQRENNANAKALKTLTGSTNFTTNGLYINANHVVIFNDEDVSKVYADVFDASFGKAQMDVFNASTYANTSFSFDKDGVTSTIITFAPHPKSFVENLFESISSKILNAKSDVLFAVMIDDSNSKILDALKTQVESEKIYTFGITDKKDNLKLYKPNRKTGVKISALDINTKLKKPFKDIIGVPGLGHVIHHKFVVVDFKGADPVVYCGSSNLAFNPEQKNGDNLIEFRDKDIVTVFAIEAIRLIDHYHWLNKGIIENINTDEMTLYTAAEKTKWYTKYYNAKDLRCKEREMLIK
ncbi:phospholipase D-like domain-containing protein [Flavobacterium soyae]|uniref:phospholipase D-like domain-containing protein n=1 Tax=Flavobacterium soyae TaxID=2903098 RepID=UPI001E566415|nr:phospholipase D-like domain-containing protein [Flavobacterium soyae]MCD9573680.1 phospholipase D-like domain-containing protein [Flavobacterium soyae]